MAWGKWILGGLGWAVAGPIGALIGFFIGKSFEGNDTPKLGNDTNQTFNQNRQGRQRTTHGDFLVSLLVLMAGVMKADGRVLKSELNVVKKFLLDNMNETQTLQAVKLLKDLLNRDYDIQPIAEQIGEKMNYSSRLELLHLLWSIAAADGVIADSEERLLHKIARDLGISSADAKSIETLFHKQGNDNWAYEVLQISPDATDDEVKKAYRRMAMKYHPDKVAGMGEAAQKSATEKFRALNDAYEYIKKIRGMA